MQCTGIIPVALKAAYNQNKLKLEAKHHNFCTFFDQTLFVLKTYKLAHLPRFVQLFMEAFLPIIVPNMVK
jgi:hypothetical protein